MPKKMAKNLSAGKGVKAYGPGLTAGPKSKSMATMTGPTHVTGAGFGHSSIPRTGYSRKRMR